MSRSGVESDKAAEYFKCSDAERAVFEGGIKLGALFHQFSGIPISEENREAVERTIEKCVMVQPFVDGVRVRIDLDKTSLGDGRYGYRTLSGEMMDVDLVICYRNVRASFRMHYVPELKYPLMQVTGVERLD